MRSFRKNIRPYVTSEIQQAQMALNENQPAIAFQHLERAHVLGQSSTLEHIRVHWQMLVWGIKTGSGKEIVGQSIRLIGALTKTAIGLVPAGNTGGSNVSPFAPMPIEPELASIIHKAKQSQ
ncbi:MAG: DUF3703 domain-containing protein [Cellvibrio sp.]